MSSDEFWPIRRCGIDGHSNVWLCRRTSALDDSHLFVLKLTPIEHDPSYAQKNDQTNFEANTLRLLSDLNPVRIVAFEAFYRNSEDQFCLVMEKATCSLQDALDLRPHLTEDEAKAVVRCVLEALVTAHSKYIVHRDVKPANIFLFSDDLEMSKLGDWGVAAEDTGYCVVGGIKGTKGYMAPEILKKVQYGRPVDIWSTGVVAFQILCGSLPFPEGRAPTVKTGIFSSKKNYSVAFPDSIPISIEGKDFIAQCLQQDPEARPTASKALEHPWFTSHTIPSALPRGASLDLTSHTPISRDISIQSATAIVPSSSDSPSVARQTSVSSNSSTSPALIQRSYAAPAPIVPLVAVAAETAPMRVLEEVVHDDSAAVQRHHTIRPESVQGFPGWLRLVPDNGDPPYYFHREQGVTQWEHPAVTGGGGVVMSPGVMEGDGVRAIMVQEEDEDEEEEVPLVRKKRGEVGKVKKGVKFSEREDEVHVVEREEDSGVEGGDGVDDGGVDGVQESVTGSENVSILQPLPLSVGEVVLEGTGIARKMSVPAHTYPRPPSRDVGSFRDSSELGMIQEGQAVSSGPATGISVVNRAPPILPIREMRNSVAGDSPVELQREWSVYDVVREGEMGLEHQLQSPISNDPIARMVSVKAAVVHVPESKGVVVGSGSFVAEPDSEQTTVDNGFVECDVPGAEDGWRMVAVPANTVYYYNAQTGVVQWASPVGGDGVERLLRPVPPPVPPRDSGSKPVDSGAVKGVRHSAGSVSSRAGTAYVKKPSSINSGKPAVEPRSFSSSQTPVPYYLRANSAKGNPTSPTAAGTKPLPIVPPKKTRSTVVPPRSPISKTPAVSPVSPPTRNSLLSPTSPIASRNSAPPVVFAPRTSSSAPPASPSRGKAVGGMAGRAVSPASTSAVSLQERGRTVVSEVKGVMEKAIAGVKKGVS
ncbi:hypothetical protein HDU98_006437 [Podochytrium sp. JEL0797]|nr:hypothetical protein HDU98_006437 [Podochytrium sp. JEL0797]